MIRFLLTNKQNWNHVLYTNGLQTNPRRPWNTRRRTQNATGSTAANCKRL